MQKTFFITGASSGIGLACARAVAAEGARVVLVGRRLDPLREAAESIGKERALAVAGDVSRPEDVERVVAAALAWSPRIDVLVNNAGASFTGTVDGFPVEQWDRLISANLTSVFLCCRAIVPVMKRQGGGLIVNIASLAGKQAFPEWAPYCATKFGLVGLSRALQEEVRANDIRLTLLYPGSVDTPLWDTFENDFPREKMLAPHDVAKALLYVANQPSNIHVDELSLGYAGGPL